MSGAPVRADVLAQISAAIPAGRALVAVDGRDGVGKTTFANDLAAVLRLAGREVRRSSLDGFHNTRTQRYRQGRSSWRGYWEDAFDLTVFANDVLEPWRDGSASWITAIHDVAEDRLLDLPPEPVPSSGVLVIDGVFLMRTELREFWSFAVLLDAPVAVSVVRGASRDGTSHDLADQRVRRYVDAHAHYRHASRPEEHVNVILDCTDLDAPILRPFRS